MRVVRCYSDKLTSDFIPLLQAYRTIRKRLSAKRQTAQVEHDALLFCSSCSRGRARIPRGFSKLQRRQRC